MPGVNSKSSRDLPSQEKGLDFSPLTAAPLARPRCCVAVAKRSVQRRKTTKRHAGCTAGPARHECQNAISGNDESSGVHVPGPPGARVSDAIADIYFTSLFFFFVSVLVIVFTTIAEETVLVTSRHTPNCYVLLTFTRARVEFVPKEYFGSPVQADTVYSSDVYGRSESVRCLRVLVVRLVSTWLSAAGNLQRLGFGPRLECNTPIFFFSFYLKLKLVRHGASFVAHLRDSSRRCFFGVESLEPAVSYPHIQRVVVYKN